MKPAWPMENWPVRPFTRFRDTARMTAMPMWLMFWKVYSSPKSGLSATFSSIRTRNGMAMKKGSQLRTARPLRLSALPPKKPAILDLLRGALAEQAGGLHQEDEDEDGEGDGVLPGGADVAGDELLGEAEDEAAEHGALHVADAAQDRGHERLEAGHQPHQGLHLAEGARVEDAGHRRQHRPEHEGEADHAVDVHAHQRGDRGVPGDRAHGRAHAAVEDDPLQHDHEQH